MTDLHVMLDLETWGTKPGCALRSIGAVTFDPFDWSHPRKTFYRNVNDPSGYQDPATVQWWSKQSAEAQAILFSPYPIDVRTAIGDFVSWYNGTGAKFVWSHGAPFDVPIIEDTMRRMWVTPPWDFRNICDTRTLFRAAGVTVTPRPGYNIKHYSLHDAHNQAHAVEQSFASLALHRW